MGVTADFRKVPRQKFVSNGDFFGTFSPLFGGPSLAKFPVRGYSFFAMKLHTTLATLMLSLFASLASGYADPLKVGDPAPNVAAVTETGAKLSLADVYKQQPYTLVYFFPKADTPGCTAQGCSLRDDYAQLQARGVAVLGVSLDQVSAQKAFKEKYHFPFTLLADPDKAVVKAFGVPTKNVPLMGEFASRQAYLIKDGKIVWVDYKAKTKDQAADVLKFLDAQKG